MKLCRMNRIAQNGEKRNRFSKILLKLSIKKAKSKTLRFFVFAGTAPRFLLFFRNYLRPDGVYAVCGFDDLADALRPDMPALRVFDGKDLAVYRRIHVAVFKGEVAAFHRTVDKFQALAIAEGLRPPDAAADQRQPFRIPAGIFSVENRIRNGDVFRVPESVLRFQFRSADLHVARILERIFPFEFQTFRTDRPALKKSIPGRDAAVLYRHVFAAPSEFGGIYLRSRNFDIAAFAQRLDAVQLAAADADALIVPHRRAAIFRQLASDNAQTADVPERITQIHETTFRQNISAFL